MSDLIFDPESHIYRYGEKIVPSVTQVLEEVGISDFSMVPKNFMESAQKLGTDVHSLLELYDKNELDYDSISDQVAPYLPAWVNFLESSKSEIIEIELKVGCEKYGYAGTLDRVLKINGRLAILDIKTGMKSPGHGVQTSAYGNAYFTDRRVKYDRYTWYVDKSHTWKLVKNDNPNDLNVFLGALTVCKFKRSNKK